MTFLKTNYAMIKIRILLCVCLFAFMQNVCGQEYSDIKIVSNSSSSEFVSDSLSNEEISERLAMLENMLKHNEKSAKSWWYTWVGIYGTATLGQGAVAILTEEKSLRQDMIVGAGTTLLGLAGQLIAPVNSGYKKDQFENSGGLSKMKSLEKLKQAEQMLKIQSECAKKGKGWQMHAMSGAVNLTSGLITWLGFKRSVWAGIGNFALNTAVTELQIWTQPTRAMKDYRQYCNKYGLNKTDVMSRPQVVWYAHVSPGGMSVGLLF